MNKVRIGTLFSERSEKVDAIDYPALSVTRNGVVDQLENVAKSNDTSNRKLIRKGDLVLNSRSDRKGSNGLAPRDGSTSLINIVLQPKDSVNPNYMYYYFKSNFFMEENYRIGKGIVADLWSTKYSELKNMEINLPDLEEQDKIVNFLDEKVTKIDNNIKLLEQELDNILLYKQEELSELFNLEDCFTTKLRNVLSMPITDGPHETPIFFDEGIPFISADAIKNNKIDFKRKRGYISENDYLKYSQKYKPKKNDIYMIKSGSTTGQVAMVKSSEKFTIWSPLAVMRCNQAYVLPKYLFHYLQTAYFQKQVELNWSFGTQQNIGMRILEQLKVTVPTLVVQREIVAKIEKFNKSYDLLITNNKKKVALLEEYKKVLINDAVTGKIKIGDEYVK